MYRKVLLTLPLNTLVLGTFYDKVIECSGNTKTEIKLSQ